MIVLVQRYGFDVSAAGIDVDHVPVGTVVPDVPTWYATTVDLIPFPAAPSLPFVPLVPFVPFVPLRPTLYDVDVVLSV